MRTMETQTLRAITRSGAGEPRHITELASAILADRHTVKAAPPDSVLSPYERELKTGKSSA